MDYLVPEWESLFRFVLKRWKMFKKIMSKKFIKDLLKH